MRRVLPWMLASMLLVGVAGTPAAAHPERPATFPAGDKTVPVYRTDGPAYVVCKPDTAARLVALPEALRERNAALLEDCEYTHVNEALDAIRADGEQGSRILLLPGVYREEPYVGAVDPSCTDAGAADEGQAMDIGAVSLPQQDDPRQDEGNNQPGSTVLTYPEQQACPYLQNLIPILGDTDDDGVCDNNLCNLQIEGTGASPLDTIIDGDYSQLNGIRGDRADGLYLRNFTVQRFEFNAVYVLEMDGFAFDNMLTRWNDEYGFLSFAVDHGLYENCEGYGNGDSAFYPGSATDLNSDAGLLDDNQDLRFGTEIRACRGHHNTLGYSGTAGNSVHTHHNEFDQNMVGAAMDSLFPDHPGLPQDHAYFHDNVFHGNNAGFYEDFLYQDRCTGPFADRDYDEGVVCPVVPLPVGTGLVLAGGNYNLYEDNVFYDNWRQGGFQFFVPAALRGEMDPTLQFDTSNFNTWRGNQFGATPTGVLQPNGTDLVWDGEGEGNCWAENAGPDGAAATTAVGDGSGENQLPGAPLPGCDARPPFTPGPGIAVAAPCATYNRDTDPQPAGCGWFTTPTPPEGRQPEAPTIQRLAGADRIATSILTSQEAFPGEAENVVLATSENFADALAGAPFAAHLGAPLLITPTAGLDPRVADELARLDASRVWLLGGTAALSEQVVADLTAAGITEISRIGGSDRVDTAVKLAAAYGSGNAFLVESGDFASALAASAAGALVGRPVLLTPADTVPASLRSFLEGGLMVDIRVVGSAVTDAVMQSLPTINPAITDVERTTGETPEETSKLMADLGVQMGQDPSQLWIATVSNWPDALGAAAAAAVDEGVLLQVNPEALAEGDPAMAYLVEHAPVLESIFVAGGTAAVSQGVEDAVAAATGGIAGDAAGPRSHGVLFGTGEFETLASAPAELAVVTGVASITRTLMGTTTVELLVSGLPAGASFPAHVHTGTCAEDGLGHFTFDPEGGDTPPNEIHLGFTADSSGVGTGSATAFAVAGEDARSVVIHAPDGTKVACAEFGGPPVPVEVETAPELASFMAPDGPGAGAPAAQRDVSSTTAMAMVLFVVLLFGLAPMYARRRKP